MPPFRDRTHAGRLLAEKLTAYTGVPGVLVLALPRGGVPIGFEVAAALQVPLDVYTVRKLGVPGHEELAMGAIASDGVRVINEGVVHAAGVSNELLEEVVAREQLELERRERAYRGDRPRPQLKGRTVILVDDGLATGATMRAVVRAVNKNKPLRVVAAAPVGAPDACVGLRSEVNEVICLLTPQPFLAVGQWYEQFPPVSDADVSALLAAAEAGYAAGAS